ncbi:probable sulfite oxidase [Plesiocystis pacifica SIR-1]|uniref:Probable sulfite oxidase n=1 Tax=Plesiocystis pacifica SIR-1 TaxID=391625 RepID=A6GGX4_9BACT|nr:molybdopterin-dependent oxidoreductase [Plesiocystis pacifica]EDM74859.1 probable sulfite oxidase [Plesiocystis pacifica SIR-1]
MPQARRRFLYLCLGGSTTLMFACSDDGEAGDEGGETGADEGGEACADPFAGGTLLASLSTFVGEGQASVGVAEGEGHDGRLALDLGTLDADSLITANEDFFVRTASPDLLDLDQPWSIAVEGLVAAAAALDLDALAALPQVSRAVLLECSGNGGNRAYGLISAAEWSGPLLTDVLDLVEVDPAATAVLVEGFDEHSHVSSHSTPGCSWVFRLEDIAAAGAMLATHMNGEPLPPDHGYPVRLIIPGWYGCCHAKWVDRIRLVDDGEPATSQMAEFATRTHQTQAHALAADYSPAIMQQAAMPVRVEQWRVEGELAYRIIGILWGGTQLTDALAIEIDGVVEPVEVCPPQATNDTWTLWSHTWRPQAPGTYEIRMRIEDPAIPTVRLDSGYYARSIVIDEV